MPRGKEVPRHFRGQMLLRVVADQPGSSDRRGEQPVVHGHLKFALAIRLKVHTIEFSWAHVAQRKIVRRHYRG